MYEADQVMRQKALKDKTSWDDSMDKRHTVRLKESIEQIGWPTISKVGKEASNQAWLLVQHADHDLEFQKRCLKLMKAEPESDVSKPNIAFFEDRIAVAEKRPQLYGTQFFHGEDGKLIPRPIFEPEEIDRRRKKMGIETFEEYEKMMKEEYE